VHGDLAAPVHFPGMHLPVQLQAASPPACTPSAVPVLAMLLNKQAIGVTPQLPLEDATTSRRLLERPGRKGPKQCHWQLPRDGTGAAPLELLSSHEVGPEGALGVQDPSSPGVLGVPSGACLGEPAEHEDSVESSSRCIRTRPVTLRSLVASCLDEVAVAKDIVSDSQGAELIGAGFPPRLS